MLLSLVAGCGGGEQRLADGSTPPVLPPGAPGGLANAVMTRTSAVAATEVEQGPLEACRLLPPGVNPAGLVVRRVGLDGSSVTFASGSSVNACDRIPDPAADRDRGNGIWCGASVGRLEDGRLNDPRLDLCTAEDGALTAFVWVEPARGARWVVVRNGGAREVYRVAAGLPVRVTTTTGVDAERSSATFEIEEYGRGGIQLRFYTLRAAVAG